jgi:hypothetical protein
MPAFDLLPGHTRFVWAGGQRPSVAAQYGFYSSTNNNDNIKT